MDIDDTYKNYLKRKLSEIFESKSGKKHLNSLDKIIQLSIKYGSLYETNNGIYIRKYPDNKKSIISIFGDESVRFDKIFDFHEGYARVYVKGIGYNFIDIYGNILLKQWVDNARDFHEGYAAVFRKFRGDNHDNIGWAFVDQDGKYTDRWFYEVHLPV